jgi:hypothetical protein
MVVGHFRKAGRPMANWIAGAIGHKGALHKELGVPEGKKIPHAKIKAATKSENPKLRKRAFLAETLAHMNHGKAY